MNLLPTVHVYHLLAHFNRVALSLVFAMQLLWDFVSACSSWWQSSVLHSGEAKCEGST